MFNWFRKSENGFTLVELMMVIVILGVLAGVAVPMVGSLKANAVKNKISSTIDAIAMGVQMYAAENSKLPTADDDGITAIKTKVSLGNDVVLGTAAPVEDDLTGEVKYIKYSLVAGTGFQLDGYYSSETKADITRTFNWSI